MWDFYYSAKQDETMKENIAYYIPPRKHISCFFKGDPFSERVNAGNAPAGNWDDYIFVGSGIDEDVSYEVKP